MRLGTLLLAFFAAIFFARICTAQHRYNFSRLDINNGLSDNRVNCFLKDRRGYVWIGTLFGLNRYDGRNLRVFTSRQQDSTTVSENNIEKLFEDPDGRIWISMRGSQNIFNPRDEKIIRKTSSLLKSYHLPPGKLTDIVRGQEDRFWFLHSSEGLYRYTASDKKMVRVTVPGNDAMRPVPGDAVMVAEDHAGGVWVVYRNGVLERLDIKTLAVTKTNRDLQHFFSNPIEFKIMVDQDNDLWIHTRSSNQGIFFLQQGRSLINFNTHSREIKLSSDILTGVEQDNAGMIWVGTDHGGVNIIDKKNRSVITILHNEEDAKSISQNSTSVVYKDRDGFIWLGTYKKGVNIYHENLVRFNTYQHKLSDPRSLPYDDINAFAEDEKGNIWIGTNGQGLIYFDRVSQRFTQYKHDPKSNNSLSSDVIVSLFFDRHHELWIGTFYGGLNRYDGKKFTHYKHSSTDTTSIGDDSIWEIYEDSQQRLWIGTISAGVDLFDRSNNRFLHYNRYVDQNSIHASYVPVITEDHDHNVWFGTGYGLDVLPANSKVFKQYLNDASDPKSLSGNSIISLLEDSRRNLWIGTSEGLNLFRPDSGTFRVFTTAEGLPHNTVLTLADDDVGNVWMGTSNGLSCMMLSRDNDGKVTGYQFRNYTQADGVQGKQFNEGAVLKTKKGELVFGGSNGFNIFKPEEIRPDTSKPRVIIADFQVANRTVHVGDTVNGDVVLPQSLDYLQTITLNSKNNVFSLELAVLNFFSPDKVRYKYMLKGFDKDWIFPDAGSRKVAYTNLDGGHYTFMAMASNSDGIWSDKIYTVNVEVLSPFWKTKTAVFVYVLVAMGIFFLARRLAVERERMKNRLKSERQAALQMHELDLMKIKFLTNVSHEFKTPLSLILAPIEKLLSRPTDTDLTTQYQMIQRNARRLLNMVNLLLDFRKMEVQEIKFNPTQGDIVGFIKDTAGSFSDISEKKNIDFIIKSNVDRLLTFFDKDKLERILFNLLSNAFKFTPVQGKVGVSINIITKFDSSQQWLELRVSDTGIGIPSDKIDKIFDRFYQHDVPVSLLNQGSGIGLSIAREFVQAHQGTIQVKSELEKGSEFIVSIPLPESEVTNLLEPEEPVATIQEAEYAEVVHDHWKVLLLVEDSEDFRFYLKDNLRGHYKILEASDGQEGLDLALKHLPDLIVSDVAMPVMDGLTLCSQIKSNESISHTPVILLTARSDEKQKIEGFDTGADDYITKPFSFEMLQSRIKNLIIRRENKHKAIRKLIDVKPTEIAVTSLDQKFIRNAIAIVEENMSNSNFRVEGLSEKLGISRVHLYKKLTSLTGKAPLEFMRTLRMQRAAQLLGTSKMSISQIAYQVGFNNPKYFAKYFKEEYNMTPSAYAASKTE